MTTEMMTIEEHADLESVQTALESALQDAHLEFPGGIRVTTGDEFQATGDPEAELKSLLSGEGVLMLVDVSAEAKESIFGATGLVREGPSTRLFVGPRRERDGSTSHVFVDQSDKLGDQGAFQSTGAGVIQQNIGVRPVEVDDDDEDLGVATAPTIDRATQSLEAFCRGVTATYETAEQSASDYPPGLVHERWVYTVIENWACNETETWKGFQPGYQATNGTLTYVIEGFLDEAASGSFQWLYLSTLGFCETQNMNHNGRNARGWGNGKFAIEVPVPSGFFFTSSSPTNTNDKKTVSTTVGFQVGYQTGQFDFSRTTTNDIYDWNIVLRNNNHWEFEQNSPFKGGTRSFPDKAIKYNASKARHQIKGWPDLTKFVFNFDTMSVWRNDAISTDTIFLRPAVSSQYNCLRLKNQWPSWSGYWWAWWYNDSLLYADNLKVDLSLISQPQG